MKVAALAALSLAIALPGWAQAPSRAQAEQALRASVDTVNWDDGGDISRFVYLNASEVFPAAVVRRAGAVRSLPEKLRPEIGRYEIEGDAKKRTLERFIDDELDGFVILHRGAVAYERYPRMAPGERHLSFSVTKAFVGMALAILEDQGRVDLSKGIEDYVPRMKGTAWAGIPVRSILDMAAGIEGTEDSVAAYSDPKHKHFLMEAALGWQPRTPDMPESVRSGDAYAFVATLTRLREPGKVRAYSSIQTLVLAEAIERITGKRLAEVIGELIWSRMGAEGDALMLVNERGQPIAHSGLCLRLRDLARFGLLFTATGAGDPDPVATPAILKRFVEDARPALLRFGHESWIHHANYQWDGVGTKGELRKAGFAGQLLYVDRERDVVIAMFGTNAALDSPFPEPPVRALVARYFGD